MSTYSNESRSQPSEAAWEKNRDLITRLYLNRGYSLKDVRQKVLDGTGFDASTQQYKRQLAKWHLGKYISSSDMDKIVEELMRTNKSDLEERTADRDLNILGHTVKLSRVKRYIRQKQKHGQVESEKEKLDHDVRSSSHAHPDVTLIKPSATESNAPFDPALFRQRLRSTRSVSSRTSTSSMQHIRRPAVEEPGDYAQIGSRHRSSKDDDLRQIGRCHSPPAPPDTPGECISPVEFVCPFWKFDSMQSHSDSHGAKYSKHCSNQSFSTINWLRDHLRSRHLQSRHITTDLVCPRCAKVFKDSSSRDSHLRQTVTCPVVSIPGIMTAEQARLINGRWKNLTEEQRWYEIWKVLFPAASKPYSPYYGDIRQSPSDHFTALFRAMGETYAASTLQLSLPESTLAIAKDALSRAFPHRRQDQKSFLSPTYGDHEWASTEHPSIRPIFGSDDPYVSTASVITSGVPHVWPTPWSPTPISKTSATYFSAPQNDDLFGPWPRRLPSLPSIFPDNDTTTVDTTSMYEPWTITSNELSPDSRMMLD